MLFSPNFLLPLLPNLSITFYFRFLFSLSDHGETPYTKGPALLCVFVCVRKRERERRLTKQSSSVQHTSMQTYKASILQRPWVAFEPSIKAAVPAAGLWETTPGNSFDWRSYHNTHTYSDDERQGSRPIQLANDSCAYDFSLFLLCLQNIYFVLYFCSINMKLYLKGEFAKAYNSVLKYVLLFIMFFVLFSFIFVLFLFILNYCSFVDIT